MISQILKHEAGCVPASFVDVARCIDTEAAGHIAAGVTPSRFRHIRMRAVDSRLA